MEFPVLFAHSNLKNITLDQVLLILVQVNGPTSTAIPTKRVVYSPYSPGSDLHGFHASVQLGDPQRSAYIWATEYKNDGIAVLSR